MSLPWVAAGAACALLVGLAGALELDKTARRYIRAEYWYVRTRLDAHRLEREGWKWD